MRAQIFRLFFFVASALIVSACGRPPELELGEFTPYVKRFELRAREYGHPVEIFDLKMVFGDLTAAHQDGLCETGDHTPLITISKPAWDKMSETSREIVVFHELGHCVLDRRHRADLNSNGVPESIMHPYAVGAKTYLAAKEGYLTELFTQK